MCRKLGAIHTYALSLVKTTTERGGGHKETTFFSPNQIINWRVKTFFTKEPETLEWIDGFSSNEKII